MAKKPRIRPGMAVIGVDGRALGTVEQFDRTGFTAGGQRYDRATIAEITPQRIYLRGAGCAAVESADTPAAGASRVAGSAADTIRVPVAEERLVVGTREVTLGEATLRKSVITEERTVAVTLAHEDVHIEERVVAERPATGAMLFQEETIRVALRGQEAVVTKEAFVTGEVVVDKEIRSEVRQITDTVRKQRVDVDEAYRRTRDDLEREHGARAAGGGRTFAQAEPGYRAGFGAAHDARFADRDFEEAEPDLRAQHDAAGEGESIWDQLRQDIRAGWEKARGR